MRVIVETRSETVDSYREPISYGAWSETKSFDVTLVREALEDETTNYHSDIFNIADGSTKCYVLWMQYSSGDSFGHGTGYGDVLHAFGSRAVAEAALKAVEGQRDSYSIKISDDFGEEISLYNSGAGYFERIESLNLETFDLADSNISIKF